MLATSWRKRPKNLQLNAPGGLTQGYSIVRNFRFSVPEGSPVGASCARDLLAKTPKKPTIECSWRIDILGLESKVKICYDRVGVDKESPSLLLFA